VSAPHDLGLPARSIAVVVWLSMVVVPLLFLGVVRTLAPTHRLAPGTVNLLLAATVVAVAAGVVLARLLPARIPLRAAGDGQVGALVRFVLGCGLCEGVVIFPLVGHLLTRDDRFLAPFAFGWLAVVLWCPTRTRWDAAAPEKEPPR
jgi:hypothetical protein